MTQTGFWVLERIGDGKSRWVTRDASVLCGDQATKSREDSELGTHPTEGRAQHPQSSRPWVVSCTKSPLSSLTATPASSLLSDPKEDSMEDNDSDGRSHLAPVIHFHPRFLGFLSPLSISASSQLFPFPALTMPTLEALVSGRHSGFASELLHEISGEPSSPLSYHHPDPSLLTLGAAPDSRAERRAGSRQGTAHPAGGPSGREAGCEYPDLVL